MFGDLEPLPKKLYKSSILFERMENKRKVGISGPKSKPMAILPRSKDLRDLPNNMIDQLHDFLIP